MSQKTKNILKGYFETGDMPTQSEFESLVDSFFNLLEDTLPIDKVENLQELLDGLNGEGDESVIFVTALPETGLSNIAYLLYQSGELSMHIYDDEWIHQLANVDNTSDMDKPVSTATQAAIDAAAQVGAVSVNGGFFFGWKATPPNATPSTGYFSLNKADPTEATAFKIHKNSQKQGTDHMISDMKYINIRDIINNKFIAYRITSKIEYNTYYVLVVGTMGGGGTLTSLVTNTEYNISFLTDTGSEESEGIGEAPINGQLYGRKDSVWNVILDSKVGATAFGTPGYLNDVLLFGNFVENDGDSDEIIIKGSQASSAEIKARSTNKKIIAPYQLPQFTVGGQSFPALGSSKSGNGIKVERIEQTSQEMFKYSLDINSLNAIVGEDLSKMWFPVYDADNTVNGAINGATLMQYLGGLVGWSMAVSPEQLYSNNPPHTSFVSVVDNNGVQYNLVSTQFVEIATTGGIDHLSFTDNGNIVVIGIVTDGSAFTSDGSVYGTATFKWTHPTGGSLTKTISLINNEPTGGIGTSYDISFVTDVYPDPITINQNTIVFKKGIGARVFYYDEAEMQVCYEDLTASGGICVDRNTGILKS